MRITRVEKRVLQWLQEGNTLLVLFGLFVTICGFAIRYYLRLVVSVDASGCLLPWYEYIASKGGFPALREQVGNYNVLYQFLIACMTYIPIYSLTAYKMLSCVFDYALAAVSAGIVYELTNTQRTHKALAAYTAVVLSPLVWLNSAAWAQCDSIYCFWVLAAFFLLIRERYCPSFLMLGIALAFKLQAIFALPFFLLFWFMKRSFSIVNFLAVPLMMIVSSLPAIVMGREGGLMISFLIYKNQTTDTVMYNQYPSFWAMLSTMQPSDFPYYREACLIFTITVLISLAFYWIRRGVEPDSINALYMMFLLIYSCVLFLPGMHERYGYVYEILGILIAILNRRTRKLLPVLLGITIFTYGQFLFGTVIYLDVLAAVNCAVYLGYLYLLTGELLSTREKCEPVKAGQDSVKSV